MATDEIDDVDDELEEYFEDVEGDLKKAKKASGREKDRQLRKVERRLKVRSRICGTLRAARFTASAASPPLFCWWQTGKTC